MFGISKDDGKSIFLVVIGVAIAIAIAMPVIDWVKSKGKEVIS
jgi:hypothetical protein